MPEILRSSSEEDTLRIGEEIGRCIALPHTLLLMGELGSGKTLLTRGICSGLGLSDPHQVHSPSFSLVNQYLAERGTIFHLDLYRLETLKDLYSIGIEDILAAEALVIVEWGEKLPLDVQPATTIQITRGADLNSRVFRISPPLLGAEGTKRD